MHADVGINGLDVRQRADIVDSLRSDVYRLAVEHATQVMSRAADSAGQPGQIVSEPRPFLALGSIRGRGIVKNVRGRPELDDDGLRFGWPANSTSKRANPAMFESRPLID